MLPGIGSCAGAFSRYPLRVEVAPGDMYSSRSGPGSLTSSGDTGSAVDGMPPYTYAWSYVSGSSYTINSPASATTTFTTTLSAAQFESGVYRCTATDADGATASADVTIHMEAI